MKGNVHLVNLEYSHCAVYRYKTHIHPVANKMERYLQFFTKSNANFVICLLDCKKCHMQYAGKTETGFSLRMNNHHKHVYKANIIPASCHFAIKDHIFNRDASFIIIEQIRKSAISRETKKDLLKKRENFSIIKLET